MRLIFALVPVRSFFVLIFAESLSAERVSEIIHPAAYEFAALPVVHAHHFAVESMPVMKMSEFAAGMETAESSDPAYQQTPKDHEPCGLPVSYAGPPEYRGGKTIP